MQDKTTMSVNKQPVSGACPICAAEALGRYPVVTEGGWFMVVKCQRCLHSVSREPWNRLGYVTRLENSQ